MYLLLEDRLTPSVLKKRLDILEVGSISSLKALGVMKSDCSILVGMGNINIMLSRIRTMGNRSL